MMKRMAYQPWVGLPNILLRDFAVPELIQGDATPERLAHATLAWLDDRRAAPNCSGASPPCTRTAPGHRARRHRCDRGNSCALSSSASPSDVPGLVAGVDEAGRGPLAGPVVAAAVILDELQPIKGLADSKVLTARRRERRRDPRQGAVLLHRRGQREEIDELNILQATLLAMRRAVEGLRLKPPRCWSTATASRC